MKPTSALRHLLLPLAVLVAIKKPDGKMVFNPTPETVLEGGDVLISIGHRQQLDRLEKLASASR